MKTLLERGFDKSKIVENGNRYLIGNGYLGYRGTLDEFGKSECVGLNIAGFYDGVNGKWRETVNAFNPFYLLVTANGTPLDARGSNVVSHKTELDIARGMFLRTTVFDVDGTNIRLECERFANMARANNLCSRVRISAEKDATLLIRAGVDTDIWELNGPHLKDIKTCARDNSIEACAIAQESGTPLKVVCRYSLTLNDRKDGFATIGINIKGGQTVTLDRTAFVLCGDEQAADLTYDEALSEHTAEWDRLWRACRVVLNGDERGQFALDYSIYHLLIIAPKGDYSIAARGLSGQTYKGAVFWDTEIFMLPFFLTALPDVAKKLVEYRINTLPKAREKAEQYGFGGAFYAWESQNGYDACSDFNVTDVFTHRPVRTYFKDKQIHISAAAAYAVLQYYARTGDAQAMLNGGLETVLECSEFARTYSYYNHVKKRYELLDVIGPDEYHERVNNNAYTNYMFYKTTADGVALARELEKKYPRETRNVLNKFAPNTVDVLDEWAKNLYLPQPNADGIIEQFDGYLRLEDVRVADVRKRLAHPREYWGGSGGVATATRVIKQADVIMLFDLYPDLFPLDIQRKNYEFYLPYTEHGSSLSHCAYALTACRIGKPEEAYSAFSDSAEIDLRGGGKQWAGDVYIGGTHPAASGGAWLAAVYGFAGAEFAKGDVACKLRSPDNIRSITFPVAEQNALYTVSKKGVEKQKL